MSAFPYPSAMHWQSPDTAQYSLSPYNVQHWHSGATPVGFAKDAEHSPPPYNDQWVTSTSISHGDHVIMRRLLAAILERRVLLPIFLLVFSLSRNFDEALDALKAQRETTTTAFVESQICILLALNSIVSGLWLNAQQYRRLEQLIVETLTPNPRPAVEYALELLNENLRKSKRVHVASSDDDSLVFHLSNVDPKVLASKLTKTLAVLEYDLRLEDPVGECARWQARRCHRDFLSFPERVRNWILRSILLDVKPTDVKRCCQLFYDIAKQSKQIYNFSAASTIASTLNELSTLHIELHVDLETKTLAELDTNRFERAKSLGQPYLLHLRDILPNARISVEPSHIVNAHGIHWQLCQILHYELQGFVSDPGSQLLSPQRYSFTDDQILGFVKKDLITYEPIADIPAKVQYTLKQHKRAIQKPFFRHPRR